MEVVIRIALMFFFIQFLVVVAIMAVALLFARLEVPVLSRKPRNEALSRGFAFAIHLPSRVLRSVARWMHFPAQRSLANHRGKIPPPSPVGLSVVAQGGTRLGVTSTLKAATAMHLIVRVGVVALSFNSANADLKVGATSTNIPDAPHQVNLPANNFTSADIKKYS